MTGTANPRQVVLSYALLSAVVAGGWALIWQPLQGYGEELDAHILGTRTEIRELEAGRTGRQQQIASTERILDELQTRDVGWPGASETVVGTHLQKLIGEIIGATEGTITTSRIFDDGLEQRVTVSTQFSTTVDHLAPILLRMESHKPYVFIDLLSVRVRDRYLQTDLSGAHDRDPGAILDVQLDASAYLTPAAQAR